MKFSILSLCMMWLSLNIEAQCVSSYSIAVEFFPDDAKMWGYPVSNDAFMKGYSRVEFSEVNSEQMVFYLHGELKIDSIISNNTSVNYSSEKVLYEKDYSHVALKTTISPSSMGLTKTLDIYYSGFMNPSKASSLSNYMCINKQEGVFLRAYYYSVWFPIFLESNQENHTVNVKNVTVRLPENFKCVVNGELVNETVKNGVYKAIWKPGIVDIWNIQCTARDYKVIEQNSVFVYYIDNEENGKKIIGLTNKLKNVFHSKLRAVLDTSSLYIIEMPKYGDISCQNVIGISRDVYLNFDNNLYSKMTIAHELVHPYTYIPVNQDNPFWALVVEGFPSFFHFYGLNKTLDHADFDIEKYMKQVEKNYVKKKQTGKDRRGNPLPIEKPILKITHNEIGMYKDVFVLSDRARLFLYHLWTEMGDEDYDHFLKALFQFDSINYDKFEALVLTYLPDYKHKLDIWLNTINYPESLHMKD